MPETDQTDWVLNLKRKEDKYFVCHRSLESIPIGFTQTFFIDCAKTIIEFV